MQQIQNLLCRNTARNSFIICNRWTGSYKDKDLLNPLTNNDEQPPDEFEKRLAADKVKLNWRTPVTEDPKYWKSKLGLFASDRENMDVVTILQQPIDLSYSNWKQKREKKRINWTRAMQQFLPERHQILGNDLASAHFIIYRGGSVKFLNQPKWMHGNDNEDSELPAFYKSNLTLEAIRCDGMELYYEGLENIRRLHDLKFISFRNIKQFDDWCLDRVSGSQLDNLEVMDLTGTAITERGLSALYRMPTLKTLYVDNPAKSVSYELTCEMLYDIIPNLKICSSNVPVEKW